MRKILSLLLVVFMLFSLSGAVLAVGEQGMLIAPAPEEKNIVILHTNDVHGNYKGDIGYSGVSAYKTEMEKDNYVALVDAGDFSQGSAISILSKGQYLVDIMNQVGYDVVVPGNHEFDYGISQAKANLETCTAKAVSCNFRDLKTNKNIYDSYTILDLGGTKVGFVGITTPDSYTKTSPTNFLDANGNYIYSFCEGNAFYSTVQFAVDAAKAAGADYVIALGHCGLDPQSEPYTSASIISNTTGIDVFIDGHSHNIVENRQVANKDGKNIILTQAGEKLSAIGKITITPDGAIKSELVKGYTGKDEKLDAYITDVIDARFKTYTGQVIAKSNVELNGEKFSVRCGETNLGDLIADAYRTVLDADIGMMNGGGIRASIPAGDVTIEQVLAVMTFGNMATVKKLTGQQIRDCLEVGASQYPNATGGFTHVSGLTYCIDPDTPSGVVKDAQGGFDHVEGAYRVYNIKVGGKALEPDKIYTVACHSFWLNQYGDGMSMFKGGETVTEKHEIYVDNVVLVKYIQENLKGVIGEEYARSQGRILIDSFSDVKAASWFAPYVTELAARGIINGMNKTTFAPLAKLTTGQALKLLLVSSGKLDSEKATGPQWLTNTMAKAVQLGLAEEGTDGTAPITRESFCRAAAKLHMLDAVEGRVFSDCTDASVNALAAAGVIDGMGDGTFAPLATLTRAQAAKIVYMLDALDPAA